MLLLFWFQISEQFRGFGELSTVRIIKSGKEVPVDLRNHTTKHPELGTQNCAVVEFENVENAQVRKTICRLE